MQYEVVIFLEWKSVPKVVSCISEVSLNHSVNMAFKYTFVDS